MIDITLDDRAVRQALDRLQKRLGDLTPVMEDIGELIVERTKQRFASSTDPAGRPWKPNSPATLARKKGKKPLIGETKSLMGENHYRAGRDHVLIFNAMEYAAIHQFGAKKGAYGKTKRGAPIPFDDIPPRPFLPVTQDNRLYPDEIDAIRDKLIALLKEHMV